jgi:hypothetical protein
MGGPADVGSHSVHALPHHALPCHPMPCHAMPCHAMQLVLDLTSTVARQTKILWAAGASRTCGVAPCGQLPQRRRSGYTVRCPKGCRSARCRTHPNTILVTRQLVRHVGDSCGLPELFRTVRILAKVYHSNVKELKPKLSLIGKLVQPRQRASAVAT